MRLLKTGRTVQVKATGKEKTLPFRPVKHAAPFSTVGLAPKRQARPNKWVQRQRIEKAIIASPTGLGANCLSGTLPPNAFTTNSLPPTT
jgi:hypothetical protein